jgi:hypothetical protein
MQYTEKQIDEYLKAYFSSPACAYMHADRNSEAIKPACALHADRDRLRFLLELHEDEDRLIPSDVWYCFEEARHTFMMGDFVASMIMCAVTVERHLAKLLEFPYYAPTDEKSAQTATGNRLINIAKIKMGSGLPLTHVEHGDRTQARDKALKIEYPQPPHHVVNQYRKGEILHVL